MGGGSGGRLVSNNTSLFCSYCGMYGRRDCCAVATEKGTSGVEGGGERGVSERERARESRRRGELAEAKEGGRGGLRCEWAKRFNPPCGSEPPRLERDEAEATGPQGRF